MSTMNPVWPNEVTKLFDELTLEQQDQARARFCDAREGDNRLYNVDQYGNGSVTSRKIRRVSPRTHHATRLQ